VDRDTGVFAGRSQFPSTAWEMLTRIDAKPLTTDEVSALAARYWRPVYRFIRAVWKKPVEDAKDLAQEFFATVFDREFLAQADPRRGNFRQFLLASLRNFLKNDDRAARAQKRGGGVVTFSIDTGPEELEELAEIRDPDEAFNRAWASELLARAMARVEEDCRAAGKTAWFEAFRRHWFSDASHADIAAALGISEFDVRNYLTAGLRDLRRACRDLVQETVDPAAVEDELALLFWRKP